MAGSSDSLALESAYDSPTFGKDGSFQLDKPVGSASISPCGRDIVLASRQGLHVIDLDSPWSPPRHLSHHTPWEVADVQWSPFAARDYWVVSTSNQKAIVWNLAMTNTRASIEHVLHAHTRAITDINFSAHHPDILATCAVDSYIHCWDLRHSARPAMTFCDWFAGATQVKWNRQDSHILASSHDKILRIWDDRKGAHPLRSIEAHATKIYGVDWNRTKTNNVATCSLDKTIKFWDYTGEIDEPTWMIHTPFPVWRARHTPFGSGLLAMPQRGDHDLHLYDRRQSEALKNTERVQPVHRFDGHDDQVKEFLWRPRGSITEGLDNREFQLVTWGADHFLRLHCVSEDVYRSIGYEKGNELKSNFNVTRKNAQYKTFRESTSRFGIKTSKPGLNDDFHSNDRVNHESRGALGMTLSGAPLNIDSGWGAKTTINSITANQRRDIDAISWMRGVKIGKRETTSSDLHRSLSSMLSPSLKTDRIWDTFESLGEEITHVGEKFNKVVFDKIDVPNRFVIVSFSGPWGLENSSIYIKTRISFPKDYPEKAMPSFSIEKTASVSIHTLQKISSEIQSVANAYLSRQKNSFEALLRYLLGEQNLEDSLLWLKERPDHTDLDLSQDVALSSSDEDEDVDIFMNSQGQRVDADDGMLIMSNAQYNVPVPKFCGALWAGDGRLVCFFPPKEEKSQSLLDLTLKGNEKYSKNQKSIFEGFGRFYSRSPIPKKTASTLETIESEDSGYEDISSSSSGSSSSSKIIDALSHHFIPSAGWRGDASETQRAVSIDESQKSSGGTVPPKSIGFKFVSFISIHNCKEYLPSKQELAQKYLLDGPDCCAANAEIAAQCGDRKLADAWELVDLILHEEVPLDVAPHPYKDEAILVVKRQSIPKLRRKGNAVELSSEMQEEVRPSMRGSIKWGSHPFGRWLVEELLRHFEEIADVQMLAMLSCVFSKPLSVKPALIPGKMSCGHTGIQNQNTRHRPSNYRLIDSNIYFAFEDVARSLLEPEVLSVQTRLDPRKGTGIPYSGNSGNSSVGASHSDPMTLLSTSGTPPSSLRPGRINFERNESQTKSISTSPEHHRQAHRSNSNLASAFAASLSRPFSFSASASSSPPNTFPRKRLSPVGSYLANNPSGVTWGTTSFFGKPSNMTEDPKSAYSLSLSDTEEKPSIARKPTFQTKLKNQDQFHNDGYATVPLLDPSQEKRYHAYRESYAHMLYIWKLPLVRCELLKYNLKSTTSSPSLDPSLEPYPVTIGKSVTDFRSNTDGLELGLKIHCTTCLATLKQHESSQKCTFCKSSQSPLICLFCSSLIQGLASPCLSCGHILHTSCRSALFSLTACTPDFSDQGQCISGCGCNCISHAVVEVEYPSRRKSSASMTVTGEAVSEQEPLEWRDMSQEEEEIWEDVAYESLAKNLGARYLTPRPSQIWRGGG